MHSHFTPYDEHSRWTTLFCDYIEKTFESKNNNTQVLIHIEPVKEIVTNVRLNLMTQTT